MKHPPDVSLAEARHIVRSIQDALWRTWDPVSAKFILDPEKEWDTETLEEIARIMEDFRPADIADEAREGSL